MILLLLFNLKVNSGESAPFVEIFFGTEQASGSEITFNLSNNQGQVWGGIHDINCDFNWYTTSAFNSPSYTVTNHNQPISSWAGLDFITSPGNYQTFGYGCYKVTNSESSSFFYIDYRDQRVGCSPYGNNGHPIDVWFKYNAVLDKFYYSNNSSDFYQISNGQLIRIWELKNAGTPQVNLLPNFWTKCLVLVQTPGNNPRLVWGPRPGSTVINYEIYRCISPVPNPAKPTYQLINTVLSSTFEYIDYEIMLSQTGSYVFYYITAVLSGGNSSSTNTVMTRGDLYKENIRKEEEIVEYQLRGNYPNPFNPITRIEYQITRNSRVSLKV